MKVTVKDVRNETNNMPVGMKKVIDTWTDTFIQEVIDCAEQDGLNPIKVIATKAIAQINKR